MGFTPEERRLLNKLLMQDAAAASIQPTRQSNGRILNQIDRRVKTVVNTEVDPGSVIVANGSVPFVNTIRGITPTVDAHLATKGYADSVVGPTYTTSAASVSGGANFVLTDSNSVTDALKFSSAGATTVSQTDASTIQISSTDANTTYTIATSPDNNGAKVDLIDSSSVTDSVTFLEGTNISIAHASSEITINSTVNTSSFLTNGIVSILAQGDDLDSVNASGGDTLKFEAGGGIKWDAALSGDVITVTPSFSGSYDNYSSWTFKEGNGEETGTVGSGQTLQFEQGTGIEVELTGTRVLTITNTSTNTDTHWVGDTIGNAGVAIATLGLGNSCTLNTGTTSSTVALGDHTHSGYLATSVFEAHPAYGIGVGEMSYIGDLTDDNTDGCTGDQTKGDIGLDTDDDVRFDSFGVGTNASGTTGEIRATNEVTAYYSDDRLKDKHGNIKKALEKVCSLNGFHYSPNDIAGSLGYDTDEKKVGVSAQEVLKVLPEAVTPAPIDPQYHTVQYDKLIPLMIEAIKELSERKCSCGV